ncbi:MAG TPA: hypothetical protein VFS44_04750 [Gemmatimonadaceae bacterium]|nr:hypothetical protein [Gemmatimonadaceae bacterium]
MIEPLELLARSDKWYLSAGDGIVFAPPFPAWLDAPGFWDGATVYQYAFAPLFTVTALDADGREIAMRAQSRRWTPSELTVEWRLANGMSATEVRSVQRGGVFASEWRVRGMRETAVHLVAWTAQDGTAVDPASVAYTGALAFTRTVRDARDATLALSAELACVGGATSWGAYAGAADAARPLWSATPFVERWRAEGIPREVRVSGTGAGRLVYAAVHRRVVVDADGTSAAFAMRLAPADPALRRDAGPADVRSPAATLAAASRKRWRELFGRVPDFRCSDPYLEHYYWYRWYGIWLNAIAPSGGNYRHPAMCEGIGPAHVPVAIGAPCHVRELRWLRDPEHARGVLRTFLEHQQPDGAIPARIPFDHLRETGVQQADWGGALQALDAVWPDDAFLREIYPGLARYAEWLARTRDPRAAGLIAVQDASEVGQEGWPRFHDAERVAGTPALLAGADAAAWAYGVFRALERLAPRAGHPGESTRWCALAERVAAAVRERMWDPASELFSDVRAADGERTGVKGVTCFFPYLGDLARAEHVAGLERHLLARDEFWTPFPIPSAPLDDPRFSAEGEWDGARGARPWNGRAWPFATSHVVEALVRVARAGAPRLRAPAAQLLHRFIRMMFHDGDLARPNCHEHYNPLTGHASVARGIDDHQQSWVVDLIIGCVMGVWPHAGGITIDPFPFGLERAELTGVVARGRRVDVFIDGDRVTARVGDEVLECAIGERIEVAD